MQEQAIAHFGELAICGMTAVKMTSEHLNGMLDLLLEIPRDVVAVSNVPDAGKRHTSSKGLCEAGQPAHILRY